MFTFDMCNEMFGAFDGQTVVLYHGEEFSFMINWSSGLCYSDNSTHKAF